MKLFREINQNNQTILMVTHSNIDASYAERVILLKMGNFIMKSIVVKNLEMNIRTDCR